MYEPIKPLQTIDQWTSTRQSQLYEPLRRSLLKQNLSQSNVSSRSNLSTSKVNDLSSSRVSRRLRSLSPQELQQIKRNTFVPITKRLVPTRNLQLIRNKRFEAIDVEERIHKPIPSIRFNSINRFNVNTVEEIVYQLENQVSAGNYQKLSQPVPLSNKFQQDFRQVPTSPSQNIYTTRKSYVTSGFNPGFNVSQVREYSPRQVNNTRMSQRPMLDTFGNRNQVQNAPQKQYITHNSHYVSLSPNNPLTVAGSFSYTNNGNNLTSFQNTPVFSPSTLPIITSTGLQNHEPRQHTPVQSPPNLYASNCNPQIRQLPTEHTLSFLASPFGSRTSFEPEIQKPQSPLNRSYDFSKLTQDSSSSEYRQKKQQEWKYNLFSIFDEPVNTKCAKTGCFKNEIIASRPNMYEWQQ